MLVSLVELFFISVVNSIRMNGNYPKRTYNELQSGCQRERGIYREREREREGYREIEKERESETASDRERDNEREV